MPSEDVLLADATTDEVFAELQRRNDAVLLACYRYNAKEREDDYRNAHGSYVALYGLMRLLMFDLDRSKEASYDAQAMEDEE